MSDNRSSRRPAETEFRERVVQMRTEKLDYIQAMLGQLREMAQAERCNMLAYLIDMAYVEASDIIRGGRPLRVGYKQGNPPA